MADEESRTCPECGSQEVENAEDGLVCEECGLVLEPEEPSDSGPEWKALDVDDERVGAPTTDAGSDFSDRIQSQREERQQREEEHKAAIERRTNCPSYSSNWTVENRGLVGCTQTLAVLFDSETLYGVRLSSGDEIWSKSVPNLTGGTPIKNIASSYINRRVFVGEDQIYLLNVGDDFVAITAETGDVHWRLNLDLTDRRRMVESNSSIYIASEVGEVLSVSRTDGNVQWQKKNAIQEPDWQSWFPPSPILTDDLVIVTSNSDDGLVTAYERVSGEKTWEFEMRETPSTLTHNSGLVLAGTVRGGVYALHPDTGKKQWRHRIPEYSDVDHDLVRPTEPILDVQHMGDLLLVTGSGFYSSVIDAETGSQQHEIFATGVDPRFSDPEGQFSDPPVVLEEDDLVLWPSGSIIQAYDFGLDVNSIEDAYTWEYNARDKPRVPPKLSDDNSYLLTTDTRQSFCTLKPVSGEPQYYNEFDGNVNEIVCTGHFIIVDVENTIYGIINSN